MNRAGSMTIVLASLALLGGCAKSMRVADLGGIYARAAMSHDELRNPVIVIPGILGSRLVEEETGRLVWGAFGGGSANPERADGARLLALPMEEGAALVDLRDDVRSDGALDRLRVSVLGLPVELDAYRRILGTLGVGGFRDEGLGEASAIDYGDDHYTCFQFDYDWRRDNSENARRLHDFILDKQAYVQGELQRRFGIRDADVKFDIVAHSMGGLITRYFLRYGDTALVDLDPGAPIPWAGARHVERAILVGTPNAGSIGALGQLLEGTQFAFFLPRYPPSVLGTMPSVYQLLPRPRHDAVRAHDESGAPVDILDPEVWGRMGWGLLDRDEDEVLAQLLPETIHTAERRRIAHDHLAKCLDQARRFHAALDRTAAPPEGLELYLVAGDAVPTDAVATAGPDRRLRVVDRLPGDGTVTRSSALMDERVGQMWMRGLRSPIAWRHATFLFADHLGLTSDPAFTDNVLYLLLEAPRPGAVEEPVRSGGDD